jgi:hypothetical protein
VPRASNYQKMRRGLLALLAAMAVAASCVNAFSSAAGPFSSRQKEQLEKYEERKAIAKARQAERNRKKRERTQELKRELGEEEWQRRRDVRRSAIISSERRILDAFQSHDSVRIAIDLNFGGTVMPERAQRSLGKQLAMAYASLKSQSIREEEEAGTEGKSPLPALELCSYTGKMAQVLDGFGARSWTAGVHTGSVSEVFSPSMHRVIYLSPEADMPLGPLENGAIYVIGGIVDKPVRRGLSLAAARESGIISRRLPLRENWPKTGDGVLTVNAAIHSLVAWLRTEDWKEALAEAVPARQRGLTLTRSQRRGKSAKVS